jgi:LysM repeat protein
MKKVIIIFGRMHTTETDYLERISKTIDIGKKTILRLEDCPTLEVVEKIKKSVLQTETYYNMTPLIIYQGNNLASSSIYFKESLNVALMKEYFPKIVSADYPDKDEIVFQMISASINALLSD